ncbi:uncharacterized protein [Arachis hypogaea]|uniref:uncharacterized protein isoform X1 n=1 Tax=Arachis hypogaea TaxID=3818 RepID=UPI000789882D|nr:uncharacterized protein LOC112806016 isoform X1 [Arachis hypogaea]
MSSFNNSNNPNLDNLLLQTLMDRLHLRAPVNNPLISQSLEDFLFDDDDDDEEENENDIFGRQNDDARSQLAKEESKLEREIIKVILSGTTDSLKPNSGQAVTVRDHHICVGFHEEKGSDYRVWEWHGHIMMFDEEHGYSPEYIYGNYFERLVPRTNRPGGAGVVAPVKEGDEEEEEEEKEEKEEEKSGNLGLRELIDSNDSNDSKDSSGSRILHRNINAGSPSSLVAARVFLLSSLWY